MTGDMCMPMRDAAGCWAVCPMICPPADIMCPGGFDMDGCPMPDMCVPADQPCPEHPTAPPM